MNKKLLIDEMISLRMKLVEAGKQANKVIGLLPLKWGLSCKVKYNIHKADNELADIARTLKLFGEFKSDSKNLIKESRMSIVKIDSEVIAEIKNALCIINLNAELLSRKEYLREEEIIKQVKRIDELLPVVGFEGGENQ